MWNISYSISALIILLIFLGYYAIRPQTRTRANRTFILLLVSEILTLVLDFVASYTDQNHESFPRAVLYLCNVLFFVFFVLRSYLFFRYTIDILDLSVKTCKYYRWYGNVLRAVVELLAVLSPFGHFLFYIDETGYHQGPLYNILYFQFLSFVSMSFVLLFTKGSGLRKLEFYTIFLYNLLLVQGICVRYALPHVVILNLFTMMAIMLIFLTFMNPENYLDRRTGLFNRAGFQTLVRELMITGKKRQGLVIVVKNYTENRQLYGGRQMDAALVAIADYLKENFPKANLYYLRNGIFVIGTPVTVDLKPYMEQVKARFKKPFGDQDADVYLVPGFIIEGNFNSFDTVEQFMDCLEMTFRQAARMDENECLQIDAKRRKDWEHRLEIKRAVENAIGSKSVKVYLQPLVDPVSDQMVGAEALARIEDPELGVISPVDFIPLAEQNGSIVTLGEQIFQKACAFMSEYADELSMKFINVNLSPIQCMDEKLPDRFLEIVTSYGLSPDMMHLEITEQENVDHDRMKKQILKMTNLGFSFVLDDYGTGYSNIERIKNLPLINIKMDMSIVREYFENPGPILPLSIEMMKKMGFGVTAEGVETKEMAETLRDLGCTYLQGYYYSKPVRTRDFVEKYGKTQ